MDLRGDIAGGLIRMQKERDGTMSGCFVPQGNAIFMPLRPHNEQVARPNIEMDGPVVESHSVAFEIFSPEAVLRHADAGLWLQCAFPHLRVRRQFPIGSETPIIYMIDPEHHTTIVMMPGDDGTRITVYGTYPLWTQVHDAYQRWRAKGCPKREQYRIVVDQRNSVLVSA